MAIGKPDPEITYVRTELLAQGIAFVETSMYWTDTYDNRECNSFELGDSVVSSGSCRSCLSGSTPSCQPMRSWFTCGNRPSRDVLMLQNLFQSIRDRGNIPGTNISLSLDMNSMAYIGWSVGAHMASRAIQLGAQGKPFPLPRCAVMVSGASYQCYACPKLRIPGEPMDEFERCNWYAQGFAANSSNNSCGVVFPPFDKPQNHWGVCPGHTLYNDTSSWWKMDIRAQSVEDPLLTEAAWDSCNETFDRHPAVLVVQPWNDTFAYLNAAQSYYEVLTRQKSASGCRMYAGSQIHGPSPCANNPTLNFLLAHLQVPSSEATGQTITV
eukprot:gnl/TRDRNA2_/TRDRNA2_129137_c0_seq2.p1 gnl/TRDRNA2_/TRDRNA2_129137_c0~~gnl/TRDRNA2_/TRDRNA2_129137_c0_seq2.p1  ORF type:complete len:372 (+),score=26.59 gnl/TRDRNA2_/TRDRNA2_129137_c0_seq2:143-1117(+)